jgi:protein-tyrosine phosphatase
MPKTIRILMVCMGNICRSPLAHAVLQHRIDRSNLGRLIYVDSAGTHGYHVGQPPDPRSRLVAKQHGYTCDAQKARQLLPTDATAFDMIVVMDKRNRRDALAILGDEATDKLHLLLDFSTAPYPETEVPDPYYGGDDGFNHVLRLVEAGCDGLMAQLNTRLNSHSKP